MRCRAVLILSLVALIGSGCMPSKVTWPLSQAVEYSGQHYRVVLLAETVVDLNPTQGVSPEAEKLRAQRADLIKQWSASTGREVSLVMVFVINDSNHLRIGKKTPCGLIHQGQRIPALGLSQSISLDRGQVGYTYMILPRVEFSESDSLYCSLR